MIQTLYKINIRTSKQIYRKNKIKNNPFIKFNPKIYPIT